MDEIRVCRRLTHQHGSECGNKAWRADAEGLFNDINAEALTGEQRQAILERLHNRVVDQVVYGLATRVQMVKYHSSDRLVLGGTRCSRALLEYRG